MTFAWTYRRWEDAENSRPRPLSASDLVITKDRDREHVPTVDDWLMYMEIAYISCRTLMIASVTVHMEALYCACQVLERGMKAVMCMRDMSIPRGSKGHCLKDLGEALGEEFCDPEYVTVCTRLQMFQEAGRYPDNCLEEHGHSLHILRFLDSFVLHIRDLTVKIDSSSSQMARMKTVEEDANPVETAALTAMCHRNSESQSLGIPCP